MRRKRAGSPPLSGCAVRASARYARLTTATVAPVGTPRMSCGSKVAEALAHSTAVGWMPAMRARETGSCRSRWRFRVDGVLLRVASLRVAYTPGGVRCLQCESSAQVSRKIARWTRSRAKIRGGAFDPDMFKAQGRRNLQLCGKCEEFEASEVHRTTYLSPGANLRPPPMNPSTVPVVETSGRRRMRAGGGTSVRIIKEKSENLWSKIGSVLGPRERERVRRAEGPVVAAAVAPRRRRRRRRQVRVDGLMLPR